MQGQTLLDHQIEEMRKAGAPIHRAPRAIDPKNLLTGLNREVYGDLLPQFARNAFENYPLIKKAEGLNMLRKSARGIPAIIVGIGPSLDKHLAEGGWLSKLQNNAIIIATDASLRPLLAHGIKPHLVMTYDTRAQQYTMFDTAPTEDLVMVTNTCLDPSTIAAWKGKHLFFNMAQAESEFMEQILPTIFPHVGRLPCAGTVGNGAILLADLMGCSPILTVGMDMCYEPIAGKDGPLQSWRYRCTDYHHIGKEWVKTENKVLYDNDERLRDAFDFVEHGNTYKIDQRLRFYLNSLKENIGVTDLPVIDCSEQGILREYIKAMRLKDAAEEYCGEPILDGQTVVTHLAKLLPDCKVPS